MLVPIRPNHCGIIVGINELMFVKYFVLLRIGITSVDDIIIDIVYCIQHIGLDNCAFMSANVLDFF